MIKWRLRGVSEEGEEIEDLFPSLEEKFSKLGLTLKKDENTFKSTYEIFKDLATVWDSPEMTDMFRASLLEDIAGKRQANIASAIIGNMQEAIRVSGQFEEAQGSAMREHEKYMQGVEAAQAKLSNAITELNQKLLHSSTIITALDMSTGFVKNAEAVGKMNYATVVLVATLGLYVMAQRKAITGMVELQTVAGIGGFRKLGADIISAGSHLLGFKTTTDATKLSVVGLNVATTGLLLGIPLLVQGIGYFIRKTEEARQRNLEFAESFKTIDSEIKTIDALIEKKEELDAIENKNEEQKKQLLDIEREISQIMPQTTTAYDEQNNALSTNLDIIKVLNEEKRKQLIVDAINVKTNLEKQIDNYNHQLEQAIKRRDELLEAWQNPEIEAFYYNDIGVKVAMTQKEINAEIQNLTKTINKIQPEIDAYNKAVETLALLTGNTTEEIKEAVGEIDDASDALGNLNGQFKENTKTLKDYKKEFQDITSTIQDYNKYLHELNSKEGLSASSKQDIIDKYNKLIPYLKDDKELRQQLIKIIKDEEQVQRQAYQNMLMMSEDFFNAKIKGNVTLVKELNDKYGIDLKNYSTLAQAKLDVEKKLLQQIGSMWSQYYNAQSGTLTTQLTELGRLQDPESKALYNQLRSQLTSVIQAKSEFDNIALGFGGINFDKINTNTIPKDKKEKEPYVAQADQYLALNNAITQVSNALDKLNTKMQTASDVDKITLLSQQNELYKQQQTNVHNLAQAYRVERAELERYLSAQGFTFSGEGDKRMIANLDAIQGKTKEVEGAFKRYNDLVTKEIPAQGKEWLSLQKSIADVRSEIEFLRLDNLFQPAKDGMASLNKEMDLLDFKFKMLNDTDLDGKMDILSQKLANAQMQASFLSNELVHLKSVGFDGSIQSIEEYNNRLEDLESQYRSAQLLIKSINDQMMADYDRQVSQVKSERERIANDIVRLIQDSYRKQQKIVINSLREQLKAEENAHKRRIQMLDEQLSKYEEIIKAQLDAINRQQDEESFEKELSKMQQERTEILSQINILSMDDSLEARNRVTELNKQLAGVDEKIEEHKNKRQIDLRKQNLNDQLDAYKKDIDAKKKAEDNKFQIIKDNIEREIQMEEWKYDKLINNVEKYENMKKNIIEGNLTEVQGLMNGFLDDFKSYNEQSVQEIGASWQELQNLIYRTQMAMSSASNLPIIPSTPISYNSSIPTSSGGNTSQNQSEQTYRVNRGEVGGNYQESAQQIIDRQRDRYEAYGNRTDMTSDQIAYWQEMVRQETANAINNPSFRFAKGGQTDTTGWHWLDGEQGKPERILSTEQTESFNKLVDYLPSITSLLPQIESLKIPNISNNVSNNNGVRFDSLLTVNGNVDRTVMPELKELVEKAAKKVAEIQKKNLNMIGIYKGV